MMDDAVVVFTAKSAEEIIGEGGTSAWRLDRSHARRRDFVVCTRNAKSAWVGGHEDHRAAFLIGKVKDVVPSSEHPGRYTIQISEYALVNVPDVWKGDRNPVKYTTLRTIGIDPNDLNWIPMPKPSETVRELSQQVPTPLSLMDAKARLAVTFGVSPSAIEIVIRL